MGSTQAYDNDGLIRIGLINFFIFFAILRLTNFNYYLTDLIGMPTEINSTGGNAFNFINYIAAFGLLVVCITKVPKTSLRWRSGWPIYVLILLYGINAVVTPFTNTIWVLYQFIFLLIALVLHLFVQKVDDRFINRFQRGLSLIYWTSITLVAFCVLVILNRNSLSYYFEEFNEVFVHSLDDFGIYKQHMGYLLGFLMSYTLFMIKSLWRRALLIFLILSLGFGIRSFAIGMFGALFIFLASRPRLFFPIVALSVLLGLYFYNYHLESLIFDTRFYSFINAYDIVQNYPFGLGLGGYPTYTEEFSNSLFANFYNVNAALDFIPLAPESDIVHLFGSLGFAFGLIHLFIIGRLVWHTFFLRGEMNTFHKCILFYFCFMTFFGISEDSIFSVNYWVFFGLASGIIALLLSNANKRNNAIS